MVQSDLGKLTILPVTPERWPDVETIFHARGCSVARGCWCMFYRRSGARPGLPPNATRAIRAEANRGDLKGLVEAGKSPGLVAYRDGVPVGWISLAPREEFRRLERSPVMKAVDDRKVWSVICFVVPSAYRGQGIAHALLQAGMAYARKHGAKLLEAYPVDKAGRSRDGTWFGPKSLYDRAGFEEVARRKPERPVLRRRLK